MKNCIKKHIIVLFMCIGASPLLFTSCNYLAVDGYLNDLLSIDTVFARQSYLSQYIGATAAQLPNPSNLFSNGYGPFETAVDEVLMSWQNDTYPGTYLYADKITQENANSYYNFWAKYYRGIRKCNTILTRIDECKDLSSIDKRDYLGLTYYMRGAFYYYLLELYGPVPILPEIPLKVDDEIIDLSYPRNTYDECVDYICENMEQAAKFLDSTRPTTLFTRPTKFAAISFISRVRLYQASPWYNGNQFYADWKTEDGRNMINQEIDQTKWAKSAIASRQIIDLGGFALHTVPNDENTQVNPNISQSEFPNGVGGIDPYHSYADMFNGEALDVRNPEIILPTPLSGNIYTIAAPPKMGGSNGLGITQKLIDAYRMDDGSDYNPSPGDFEKAGNVHKVATGYQLQTTVAKMYLHREARFYASIGFCECFWPGTSLSGSTEAQNRTNLTVTYYVNGSAAPESATPLNYNLTGYTLKKYIHPEDNMVYQGKGGQRSKTFPAFRYAEILLNYVEAINELEGLTPYSEEKDGMTFTVSYNPSDIMYYFNMIRYRAGLPGITLNEASDQNIMRDLIKRERMVEFACEGRRYHDLRRWGIASEEENKPVQGMDVTQKSTDRSGFYTVININHKYAIRSFDDKMYFYPIPRQVLDRNPKLTQNPGWSVWNEW